MQKWDYAMVQCGKSGNGAWRPRIINGVLQSNWEKGKDLFAYLGDMGEYGWELVQVHVDTIAQASWAGTNKVQETGCLLFFKRPKP